MAKRRMFSLSVVDTDAFIEMPLSSRLLYYELGMRADDDGFVDSWKKIVRFTGLSNDDMKVLVAKKFVIPFESGVIVIRHWRLNNYLQRDRTTETLHKDELSLLELNDGVYDLKSTENTECIQDVYNMDTKCIQSVYTDKIRLDNNIYTSSGDDGVPLKDDKLEKDFELIWKEYPRKEGKNAAFKKYKAWLKGRKYLSKTVKLTNEQMWNAVQKYADEVKAKNTERQYIKQGETFFGDAIIEFVEGADDG